MNKDKIVVYRNAGNAGPDFSAMEVAFNRETAAYDVQGHDINLERGIRFHIGKLDEEWGNIPFAEFTVVLNRDQVKDLHSHLTKFLKETTPKKDKFTPIAMIIER